MASASDVATTTAPNGHVFAGWQSLEVIKLSDTAQYGAASSADVNVRFGDVNGDGRQNIVVVKRRQSLIEWYSAVAQQEQSAQVVDPSTSSDSTEPTEPTEPTDSNALSQPLLQTKHTSLENINQLPLSARLQKHEFRLQRLPRDVVVLSPGRLAVLVGPPDYVEIYTYTAGDVWTREQEIPLLTGEPLAHLPMLYVAASNEILIQTDQGTEVVTLKQEQQGQQEQQGSSASSEAKESQVRYLRPREHAAPWRWFLSDLDGDGDEDLIKTYGSARESIEWHRNEHGFRPPQVIYDQKIRDAVVLNNPQAASDVYMLDAIGSSLLRRYQLQASPEQRFGKSRALSLPDDQSTWTGVKIGDQAAIVVVDATHPQFLVYVYAAGDWKQAISFPCIDNVEALYAPQAHPGMLLLKRKDEAQLYQSQWSQGRFSFPQPWSAQAIAKDVGAQAMGASVATDSEARRTHAEDQKILDMGRVADTIWWTQKQADNIVLFVWNDAANAPTQTVFRDQGKKIEAATWLGQQRLLVKDVFKRDARILTYRGPDKDVAVVEDKHLKNIKLEEYRAQKNQNGEMQAMRIHNGVAQWLDDDLYAQDQIMLEDGLPIADYVRIGQEQFVLDAESRHLISLQKDASGVLRRAQEFAVPGGYSLRQDPVLGLFVQEPGWICRLDRGQTWSLQVLEHIDENAVRPQGMHALDFDRLFTAQIAVGVGSAMQTQSALLVSDDGRHQLMLFAALPSAAVADETEVTGVAKNQSLVQTKALAAWRVFEDTTYPYGAPQTQRKQQQPQSLQSVLFDDDAIPDLVLLCQDRLLIYLSQKSKE